LGKGKETSFFRAARKKKGGTSPNPRRKQKPEGKEGEAPILQAREEKKSDR